MLCQERVERLVARLATPSKQVIQHRYGITRIVKQRPLKETMEQIRLNAKRRVKHVHDTRIQIPGLSIPSSPSNVGGAISSRPNANAGTVTIPLAWHPCLTSTKHHEVCTEKVGVDLIKLHGVLANLGVVSASRYGRGVRVEKPTMMYRLNPLVNQGRIALLGELSVFYHTIF